MANPDVTTTYPTGIPISMTQLGDVKEQNPMIRVLIADDSTAIRDGLSGLLKAVSDFDVVGLASDGLEAVQKAKELQPDVILMDAQMPNMDGVEATKTIRESGPIVGILFLSVFAEYLEPALTAGADGFLLKDCDLEELLPKVRHIAAKTQAARKLLSLKD